MAGCECCLTCSNEGHDYDDSTRTKICPNSSNDEECPNNCSWGDGRADARRKKRGVLFCHAWNDGERDESARISSKTNDGKSGDGTKEDAEEESYKYVDGGGGGGEMARSSRIRRNADAREATHDGSSKHDPEDRTI